MTQIENSAVKTYTDLSSAELIEKAIQRGEGRLSDTGALVAVTGERTGRSPQTVLLLKNPALRMISPGEQSTAHSRKTSSTHSGTG